MLGWHLKPESRRHAYLPVRGVVDVRIPCHTHEPAAPIGIRADRPGFHDQSVVAGAMLPHDIERQAPIFGEIPSEIEVRVGLSGAETVVPDGINGCGIAVIIAVADAE